MPIEINKKVLGKRYLTMEKVPYLKQQKRLFGCGGVRHPRDGEFRTTSERANRDLPLSSRISNQALGLVRSDRHRLRDYFTRK